MQVINEAAPQTEDVYFGEARTACGLRRSLGWRNRRRPWENGLSRKPSHSLSRSAAIGPRRTPTIGTHHDATTVRCRRRRPARHL